jgi:hypothetical protein
MNWFSRTTSIAGMQVSNWILLHSGCRRTLDHLLGIHRTLKHAADSSIDQGALTQRHSGRLIEMSAERVESEPQCGPGPQQEGTSEVLVRGHLTRPDVEVICRPANCKT